ncbi:MAG: type IX secretion system protein PorQ [Bacteroidales bacterium]
MLKKTIIASYLLTQISLHCVAQIGGQSTYNFLKVNSSPKLAAMGGVIEVPIYNDVGMIAYNPTLLDSSLHQQIGVNYLHYPGNISHTAVNGALCHKYGTFGISFISFNYGVMEHFDEIGTHLGQFNANEFAISAHYSHTLWRNISTSLSLSSIISQLERYKSYGLAINLGVRYTSSNKLFSTSLLLKNIGSQLKPYTEGNYESLPFEVQWGFSHKFENAPLGISLSLTDLQNFKLYNNTKTNTSVDDQAELWFMRAGKEFLSHVNIGVSIIPTKYLSIMGGYNFRRQNELSVGDKLGGAGFSLGFALHLRQIEFSYGLAMYHVSANSHHIGLIIKLYNS